MKILRWSGLVFTGAVFFLSSYGACEEASLSPISSTPVPVAAAPVEREPLVWPVAHSANDRPIKIVSGFGRRTVAAPDGSGSQKETHEGIDFNAPAYALIRAAHSGRVLFAGFSHAYVGRKNKKEVSRLVIIKHPDRKTARYVHLNQIRVRPGEDVEAGQIIGTVAPSDEWTETVVHFELRDVTGKAINPVPYFSGHSPEPKS